MIIKLTSRCLAVAPKPLTLQSQSHLRSRNRMVGKKRLLRPRALYTPKKFGTYHFEHFICAAINLLNTSIVSQLKSQIDLGTDIVLTYF